MTTAKRKKEQRAPSRPMPKQNTTTKQSSGGGFQFENEVVAYVLAHILARSSPFAPPGGIVEWVGAQRPATEWLLDDLLVTVRAHGVRHRLAFSVKSNQQISENGFPPDFVRVAWEQLLHTSSTAFEENCDYLGLITVPSDSHLKRAVFELLGAARHQEPSSLAAQVDLPNRGNDIIRKLFKSAQCPDDLETKHDVEEGSAGRLLRRVIWVPLDFEDENSVHRARVLELCQHQLHSGSADEAQALWARLKEVADHLRRFGGDIELVQLVDELRGRFSLRDFPDHTADWERLLEDTLSALRRVRSTIGGAVTLPRRPEHEEVKQAFVEQRAVILLGASGSGKSVIAKGQAERSMTEGRSIWLDAGRLRALTFADWRTHLGLAHALGEIFRTTPAENALLVLDGLDLLYDEADFATAAEFVQAARLGDETSPWRVLITCTPEAWDRVRAELVSRDGLPPALKVVNVGPPTPEELTTLWSKFPQLRTLATRHYLAPVLLRPKVLDLLATHVTIGEDHTTIGESDLARLFWDRQVAYGPHAAIRAETALRFAQYLADTLVPDVSNSALSTALGTNSVSEGIDKLAEDHVLRRAEGRVAFDHDLYADWVRVHQLADMDEAGQLPDFLTARLKSPVWHRAFRLYGVQLLEQSHDLASWTSAFKTAGSISAPAGPLAQDILLESTAFASTSGTGLFRDELWPLLSEHSGRHLERLLNRLFHTATIPNLALVEVVVRQAPELEIYATANARLPYPFYWSGILLLLHAHREEIPARVRGLTARVADLWLRSTDRRWPFRQEAAALAIALGEAMLKDKEERNCLFLDNEVDQQVYRAVLASGYEEPDTVTQIVLEASGRRRRRSEPPPLSEEERAALRAKYAKHAVPTISGSYGPLPEPWPYGPAFRVDGALQKAVLESDALLPLAATLPDVAREVLLALLINEPERRNSYNDYSLPEALALEWPSRYPPFYTRGPFRTFLVTAEAEAVSAILQLVDHATDRWVEFRARYLARERKKSSDEVKTPVVPIQVDGKKRDYIGDGRVFAWSLRGPDSGGVIASALAALETHLYDRVDAGDDVTPLVQRLLTESRSLAIVGLLSVFGRRHPHHLRGPLRGLLVSPYALKFTLMGSIAPGWQTTLSLVPKPLQQEYRAWHEMPHRKTNLSDLAQYLFVNDPSLRPFFLEARDDLQTGLQPGGPYENWDFVENLVAQFDPSNYSEVAGEDGKTYIQYAPPEKLQLKHAEMDEAGETGTLLMMMMPVQCRQILDGNEPIQAETLDGLWASTQRISGLGPGPDGDIAQPANSLAGIAAVFVQRGEAWLSKHPERAEWARRVLLDVVYESKEADAFYGPAALWDRLTFATEALPVLWSDDPNAKDIRESIAKVALYAQPGLVSVLTSGVAAARERLSEDHLRLLRVVLLRAGLDARLRQAARRLRWDMEDDDNEPAEGPDALRSELEAIERAFVEGTLKAAVPGLDEVAPLGSLDKRGAPRRPHRRQASRRLIEESLLVAAYRGVPNPGDDGDFWLPVWERIALDTLGPLAPFDNELTEDLDDPPGTWGTYFMERVAGVVAAIENPLAARRLWQPIIDLGASASQWVSRFARHWTGYALYSGARGSVVESWIAMIDAALANPHWNAGNGYTINSYRTGELWRALLGLRSDGWTDELRPRVQLLHSRLTTWVERHLANSDNVRAFAHFLTFPAAAELVFDGLIWLDRASQALGDRFWGRPDRSDPVEDAVLSLLAHVWRVARAPLRRNGSAFNAFRNLLQILVSRQHAPALELSDRVGSFRTGGNQT